MNSKVIAVVGANGKMGSCVCEKLQNFYKILKIDCKNSVLEAKNADLIIDFSSGENSARTAEFCGKYNIPLIIGATGQTDSELEVIEKASRKVPVLVCSNFSVGIFLLKNFIDLIYRSVQPEVIILEKHHSEKKDSPSGTALDLQKYIKNFTLSEVQILSERGGREIGTHRLDFYFGDELVSIEHKAFTRDAFADGVLISSKFMLDITSPGLYSFDEILMQKFKHKKISHNS